MIDDRLKNVPKKVLDFLEGEDFDLSYCSPVKYKYEKTSFTPLFYVLHKEFKEHFKIPINPELIQDMSHYHSLNVEEEYIQLLKEEIEKQTESFEFKSYLIKKRFEQNKK